MEIITYEDLKRPLRQSTSWRAMGGAHFAKQKNIHHGMRVPSGSNHGDQKFE